MRQIISGLLIFLLGLGLVFCKKKQDWEIVYPSAPIFSVKGFVYDDHNKMPIEGMEINLTVIDSVYGTCSSNSLGYFEIDSLYSEKYKKIDYLVDFFKEGYEHVIHDIAVVRNSVNMGDLYIVRAFKLVGEYPAPGNNISGIAFDGQNIWTCDESEGTIYKHDQDMNIIAEYSNILRYPRAMTFADSILWIGNRENFMVYAFDKNFTIIDSVFIMYQFDDPKSAVDYQYPSVDLTYKDGILISCENTGDGFMAYSVVTGEFVDISTPELLDPYGVVWSGEFFLVKYDSGIYKLDANFGVLEFLRPPGDGTNQLTCGGTYFYTVSNDAGNCRIYKFLNVH